MHLDLSGRTAVVTGASRGIGAATARCMDQVGARVVLVARTGDDLRAVAAELTHQPAVFVADLSDVAAVEQLVLDVEDATGGVDVLVNNAAAAKFVPAVNITDQDITFHLDTTLRASILLSRGFGGGMVERRRGSIVNVSSIASMRGGANLALYSAAKAGLDGWTRALAAEWGPRGVRVNGVQPGLIRTDASLPTINNPAVLARMLAQSDLCRVGEPEEMAAVITFLASDASSYITGQMLAADGGTIGSFHGYPSVDEYEQPMA